MAVPGFFGERRPVDVPVRYNPFNKIDLQPAEAAGFDLPKQLASNWCWVACALGIARYYRVAPLPTQCRLAAASLALPNGDCCQETPTSSCNTPTPIGLALKGQLGCGAEPKAHASAPLTAALLEQELTAGRPVVALVRWSAGEMASAKHYVVISRIFAGPGGVPHITVHDPLGPVQSTMPLTGFLTGYGTSLGVLQFYFLTWGRQGRHAKALDLAAAGIDQADDFPAHELAGG